LITVWPEILVSTNSRPTWTFLGATLADLLRPVKPAPDPASLKIDQQYAGRPIPLTWTNPAVVLRMPLLEGERISW
jgi:hypothetical protein